MGAALERSTIEKAYARWAPVYDHTFGKVASEGRKHAVEIINTRQGRVLDTAGQVHDGNAQPTIDPLAQLDGQSGVAAGQESQIPYRLILRYSGHIERAVFHRRRRPICFHVVLSF